LLHVRKLISKSGYTEGRELVREAPHKWMSHSGARTVRQRQQKPRFHRPHQDGWYFAAAFDRKSKIRFFEHYVQF
jgi:hypothetical protein